MIFKILKQTDKEKVKYYIDNKLKENKQYIVDIKEKRSQRSVNQNALYWLWVACICDETGGNKDQIHEELKQMFLPKEQAKGITEIVERPVSTTSLDTLQFKQYLDKIQVFANTELGIDLPNPDDLVWEQFESTYENYI